MGFKPAFFGDLTAARWDVDFVEVHAENFMGEGGRPQAQLRALRADRGLSVHGVALSLGGAAPPDAQHLHRLAVLCARYEPELVSEHLAWSTHAGTWFPDLLPLAYTETSLRRVVRHVDRLHEVLRRRVLIENPSTYVTLAGSAVEEPHFLAELAARTGCGLLLDLNNIVVSCRNRGTDPLACLAAFPLDRVEQIHVAGHATLQAADGTELRVDDHGSAVSDEVWQLLREFHVARAPVPTMIEWDTNIPDWTVLADEVRRIAAAQSRPAQADSLPPHDVRAARGAA